ncbi:MAG: hypothetical protein ACYDAQ_16240 [Mycobacteriales bacterium]
MPNPVDNSGLRLLMEESADLHSDMLRASNIANVSSAGGIATAASIAPVEAMHAAILHYVLGTYPVPASFLGTAMAVPLTAFTG